MDKSKIDVCRIAQHIVESDMSPREQKAYIDSLWNDGDDNMLRLFFGKSKYLYNQIQFEISRIIDPELFNDTDNVVYGKRYLENMTLYEIGEINPEYEKELRLKTFEQAKTPDGGYVCAGCGRKFFNKIPLQVDHIVPMSRGGKTVPENLQILCRNCNGEKSDS